jgi:cell volume regulation protein A
MHEVVVAPGSQADGSTVNSLELGDGGWISLIRRDGRLVQVRGSTRLEAGDAVLALASDGLDLDQLFGGR